MMIWNFLIVDDNKELAEQTKEILVDTWDNEDTTVFCDIVTDFEEAKSLALKSKYDLVVLDLKDDTAHGKEQEYKGEEVLNFLRSSHFVPVVFYTGHAHKIQSLQTPVVRVVSKGDDDVTNLRLAVTTIFDTKLPTLLKRIHELQREYLWDHVDKFWSTNTDSYPKEELAFLLARRLGTVLSGDSIRNFLNGTTSGSDIAHPVEMYIWPPIGIGPTAGDIILWKDQHYVIMNPACDFAQNKIENIVLIKCEPIEKQVEYIKLKELKLAEAEYSLKSLTCLVRDRRDGKGVQPERFKFFPKTHYIPTLVADFQSITTIDINTFSADTKRIATLDTPFAEALLSGFSRYYGRIGVPNLDSAALAQHIYDTI
ncbi:response regulator [Pseudomonas sp. RIT-To-2]|uniref:response regulator n=1 Tax=Pseudomonas sp. RIT-To-2 TaxID=3462541 RepID=UPI0024132503